MDIIKRVLMKESLLKDSFIMSCSIVIGSLFGFLFHVSIYRLAGNAVYSIVGVLVAIITFFSVFSQLFQMVAARYISISDPSHESGLGFPTLALNIFKRAGQSSLLIMAIYILLVPLLSDYLNLPSKYPLLIIGTALVPLFLLGVCRGVLQGRKQFIMLGALLALENVVKIIIALLLIFLGLESLSGPIGITGGLLLTFFVGLIFVYSTNNIVLPYRLSSPDNFPNIDIRKYTITVFPNMLLIMAILNVDILLVKHYLEPEIAGQYQVAAFMSRLIIFIAIAISQAVFPKTAPIGLINKDSIEILKKAMFYVATLAAAFYIFVIFLGEFLINLFFGPGNTLLVSLLPKLILVMGMFGLIYNFICFYLSIGITKYWWGLLIFICLEILVIHLFHDTASNIADNLIYLMFAGVGLLSFLTFRPSLLKETVHA